MNHSESRDRYTWMHVLKIVLDEATEEDRCWGQRAGIGAAVGATLGSMVGGKEGAMVGGAVGAILGVTLDES